MEKIQFSTPKASLYPVPVALVTCYNENKTNIITISWTGIMCSNPPTIYISVRPERYSYKLLSKYRKFCLNIPSTEMLNEVDYCGNNSGERINKSAICRFELIDLMNGFPKAIRQCKHHLFCNVIDIINIGSHNAFIAEVVSEFIDQDYYDINHCFNYNKIAPIAYCRKGYYSIGEKIGEYGKERGEVK